MNDTLLFLHVLAAFCLAGTIVMHTAYALGAPATARGLFVADRLWDVGGAGTLIFGIWMALDFDQYGITDGWILLALGLFAIATALGFPARQALEPRADAAPAPGEDAVAVPRAPMASAAMLNGLRALVFLLLLLDMVMKPGA